MTPDNAARLLAIAGTLDPRLKPPTAEDAQARSLAWAAALHADMDPAWAQQAIVAHYAHETTSLMPAHLNTAWRTHSRNLRQRAHDLDARRRRAEEQRIAVPMPPEFRERIRSVTGR